MNSLDYKIYRELGKSYLQDAKNSVKNLISKPIRTLTLVAMLGVYACSGSGGNGGNDGGGGQTYECNNNQDDDGDGLIDMLDPGCSSLTDNDEYNAPGNQAPVAVTYFLFSDPPNTYHPGHVHPGNIAAFDGSSSYDPDNSPNPISHLWSILNKPGCSSLTNSNIMPSRINPLVSVIPDCVGDYNMGLDVNDGADTGSDTIDLLVQDNNAPVANAGNDIAVPKNIAFTIDATNSSDTDGIISLYELDLEGDGTYEVSNTTGIFNQAYPLNICLISSVRVTDDDNVQDIDQTCVYVGSGICPNPCP